MSLMLAAAVVCGPLQPRAMAQQAGSLNVDRTQPPSPTAAMAYFRVAEKWVRSWQKDTPPPDKATLEKYPELFDLEGDGGAGVQVSLRYAGRVVARATVAPGFDGGLLGLRSAVRDALSQAEQSLPVPNDALREQALRDIAAEVLISLELTSAVTPIVAESWTQVQGQLAPGIDGVAAKLRPVVGSGSRGLAPECAFPGAMLATNTHPMRGLSGVVAKVLGEGGAAKALLSPRELAAAHGVAMYRFKTVHLAQPGRGEPPVFLTRGQRFIDASQITTAELRWMADAAAAHLVACIRAARDRDGLAMVGPYEPWSNTSDPVAATPDEASLAAYALAVYSASAGVEPEQAAAARDAARHALGAVEETLKSRPADQVDRSTSLLYGIAARELFLQGLDGRGVQCTTGVELSWKFYATDRRPARGPEADARGLSPSEAALLAFAWAQDPWPLIQAVIVPAGADRPRPGAQLELGAAVAQTDAVIRAIYREAGGGQLVTHMPWLGWAEQALPKWTKEAALMKAVAGGAAPGVPAIEDIPAAVALRQMRDMVWQHQVLPVDLRGASTDLAGSILFTRAAGGVNDGGAGSGPVQPPTWNSVRPLAFLASMLADNRLTEPHERGEQLARLLAAFRFIRQIQADSTCGWVYPNTEMAIGGVRAAPAAGDQTMPPDATSMSLLAVCHMLKSLDALAAQPAGHAIPAAPK